MTPTVWAVVFSNYSPLEVDSLHANEESAKQRVQVLGGMWEITEMTIEGATERPIDMLLWCPKCHAQHIDAPDERNPGWTNPPHRKHLCHNCGHLWKPCNRPTNGVVTL